MFLRVALIMNQSVPMPSLFRIKTLWDSMMGEMTKLHFLRLRVDMPTGSIPGLSWIVWYLVRQLVKVAVSRPLLPAAGPVSQSSSHFGQLLLAVAQVADVDDGHLVESQHGPLLDAAQDDGVQLSVVVQKGAVHLQAQQVGGEVDVLDARGELAGLRRQHLGGFPRPQHLPPAAQEPSVSASTITFRLCSYSGDTCEPAAQCTHANHFARQVMDHFFWDDTNLVPWY